MERQLSPVTVNKIYGSFSTIYQVMRRHGIKNNPTADVERKEKPAAELDEDGECGGASTIASRGSLQCVARFFAHSSTKQE